MARRSLPASASVATTGTDGRLFAPSAARNAQDIVALVTDRASNTTGSALELASGTGQHVVQLAAALPNLLWQPTDIDADRRRSIDTYVSDAARPNIAKATALDATLPGWGATHAGQSLILVVNLLHLISTPDARTLINEAAIALAAGGTLMIYGPFMRDDALTTEGDKAFHTSLRAHDPEIGYKSDFDVVDWGQSAWLDFADMVEMPANNLAILWQKPA